MEDIHARMLATLNQFDEEELKKFSETIRAVAEDGCDLQRALADFEVWFFHKRDGAERDSAE
ncbi:MAG TPA: hypothetical protein EYQ81_05675 [Sneathiellales bacterium]|nr:hypothetical protein [Sneathiellales bacterium]